MAENPLIDLAQTVMIERYGLEEETYALVSFSEGAKTIGIKMSDGAIPVQAWFPRDFLRYEEMKRWEFEKKELYVKSLISNGMELPEELMEDEVFEQLYIRLGMQESVSSEKMTFDLEAGDRVVLKLNNGDLTVEEGQDKLVESTEEIHQRIAEERVEELQKEAEEFEAKVEGKKTRKLKKK
jgi:hypothetical protein